MRRLPILLLLLLAACAGARTPASSSAPSAPVDGDERLGDGIRPLAYEIELQVDPARDRFRGVERVRVRLAAPAREIRLHGRGLHVTAVDAGGVPGTAQEGKSGGMRLVFADELPAGERTLSIAWDAPLVEGLAGLYRVPAGDHWYAYTQFEALDARRAFPCFDEPRFKTPITLTVRVPHGNLAASNAPIATAVREGQEHVIRFEPTQPLPTYLLALAVGPFDVLEGGVVEGVPVRLLAPLGTGELGRFALGRVGPVLRELHGFFGQRLPFPKLDLVAVPAFAYGAMENPGLVTFRDSRLLDGAGEREARGLDGLLAHELAHFWFGDLVTMAWWDDVWLNEGMATFVGSRVVQALHEDTELDAVRAGAEVMLQDGLGSARAVRQPIRDGGDVLTAFDGITYTKGMAVLRMVEAWIGPEVFRAGLRAYVQEHADGNATTADLLRALSEASGQPVERVASTFLDRPGVPLVGVSVTCGAGPARVHLTQERYRPLGSSAQGGSWIVPVCLAFRTGAGPGRACTLLAGPEADVELPACPEHLHPNAGETGYYRWQLPAPELLALARAEPELAAAAAAGLPSDLDALLAAGRLEAADHLEMLGSLLRSKRRTVVEGAVASLGRLRHAAVEGDPGREASLARFVRAALGPEGRRLGVQTRPGESPSDEVLRPTVIAALVDMGHDAALAGDAALLAGRWLSDRGSVPRATAQLAVPLAAMQGNADLHRRLLAALGANPAPAERALILGALGSFRDRELLARSVALYLEAPTRPSDFWNLAGPGTVRPDTRPVIAQFLDVHYDAVASRLGDMAASLPGVGAAGCSDADAGALRAMFGAAARRPPGTDRMLAQAVESIEACARLRDRIAVSVGSWLSRRAR